MSLTKEINFDGSSFWLGNEKVGEVDENMKFQDGYDKDFIDKKKSQILGKITEGGI